MNCTRLETLCVVDLVGVDVQFRVSHRLVAYRGIVCPHRSYFGFQLTSAASAAVGVDAGQNAHLTSLRASLYYEAGKQCNLLL